jgi:glycosyltransferase involved in cell wall biosynthesis
LVLKAVGGDNLADLQPDGRHLIWVYPGSLAKSLDAATWLATTRALREMGWRVTLIHVGPPGEQAIRGVPVYGIPRANVYFVRQISWHMRVAGYILRHWQDTYAVLFHEMSVPWLLPLKLLRPFKKKPAPLFVMDTRTLHMMPLDKERFVDRLRRTFYGASDWAANRFADGRLAITRRMAEAVAIPTEKLWGIWPSGVELEIFSHARDKRHWPNGNDPIVLVHPGSQHHERNLMALSRAVVRANEEGGRFRLRLVGEGDATEELRAYAATVNGIVSVEPPVPHGEMPDVLAAAHAGTIPFPDQLKFQVSSPIKLFEYLAVGLPILSTRQESVMDAAGDADCIIWAEGSGEEDLLHALRDLWQVRDTLPEKSKQAVEASHKWTWATSAKKLSDALLARGTAREAL